jgi:hypothetical protein
MRRRCRRNPSLKSKCVVLFNDRLVLMAKKKRALPSPSNDVEDCNAEILQARSKKSRDEHKQKAARAAQDDAAAEATAAPHSRRARKVIIGAAAATSCAAALTVFAQALERLRDRQDKDSRRAALLAELSANNSTLQALQQQQQHPGCSPATPSVANMLTSSRTIGLGARVAATRAPDGSHVPHERRPGAAKRRGGPTTAATTTALSGSSESDDDVGSSSSSSSSSSSNHDDVDAPLAHDAPASQNEQHVDQQESSPPLHTARNLQHHALADRRRRSRGSSSSSSEDDNAASIAAGDSQLTRGPAVAHPIPRSNEARDARLKLPIVAEEQPLMDLVHHTTCVVLQVTRTAARNASQLLMHDVAQGETGCGKSTQVPQFL